MNVTASGLNRFRRCPGSAILPQVRTSSEHAERGTAVHTFLEKAAYISREEALKGVPSDVYDICKGIDVKGIYAEYTDVQTELAFALNPRTRKARYLGRSLGRDYKLEEDEIGGSEDVVAKLRMFPQKYAIADFKTGDWVIPAKSNAQLLFFSSCLHLIYGADEVVAEIIYIGDNGEVETDRCTHTIFDIDAYLDSLKQACDEYDKCVEQLKTFGTVSVKPGDWCQYCSSMPNCPAYTALAKSMVSDITDLASKIQALTPEEAGKAWLLKKRIGDLYYQVDDGLKEYARQYGIDLENGKHVGTTSYEKQFFSADKAMEMLKALGASKEEIAGCYSTKQIVSVRELKRKDKKVEP